MMQQHQHRAGLERFRASGQMLLDLRTEIDFTRRRLPRSVNIPLAQLKQRMFEVSLRGDPPSRRRHIPATG